MTYRPARDEAQSYLLSRLSPEETERFEERLLAGDELIAETDAAEAELIDELVRGTLTEEEGAVVTERLRGRPERIAFAKALADRSRPRPRRAMRWMLPLAASLLLATGAVLVSRPSDGPLPEAAPVPRATLDQPSVLPPGAPASRPVPPALRPVETATFTFALAATRDDGESPQFILPSSAGVVALRIRINPADQYPSYEVVLTRGAGKPVWSGSAKRQASASELLVEFPAALLSSGEHQIAAIGLGSDGSREELGYHTIVFSRR